MSCGVARQCMGSAGRATNCRAGVSRHGHAFTARGLCPPKAWADDPARLAGAHVPDGTGFATKPAIALSMIERAIGADVPFRRVAADRVYGVASMGKNPGRPERDVFPGWGPTAGSPRGASRWPLPEPPRGSPGICRRRRGGVCRRVTARKAGDCMTGSVLNWPIRVSPEPGPVACRVAARSPRAIPPFSPHGVPPAQTSGNPAGAGGAAGRQGVFPDRQNRARPRPHRDTVVAWLAPSCFPGYARLCDDGHDPVPRQRDATAKKNTPDRLLILSLIPPPIPWSMQEIRRVFTRLARRRIRPAHVIAWSLWRRAHQAAARESHPNPDRNCSARLEIQLSPAGLRFLRIRAVVSIPRTHGTNRILSGACAMPTGDIRLKVPPSRRSRSRPRRDPQVPRPTGRSCRRRRSEPRSRRLSA